MLVTLERSPHSDIRGTHVFEGLEARLLISPCRQSLPVHRSVKDGGRNSKGIKQTIRDMPRVLINASSGRLCATAKQFEFDLTRIEQAVTEHC